MKRAFFGLLGFVLAMSLCVVALGRLIQMHTASPNPIYTVKEVRTGLLQRPRAWAGRTVLIDGAVEMSWNVGCASANQACQLAPGFMLGPANARPWSRVQQVSVLMRLTMAQGAAQPAARQSRPFSSPWSVDDAGPQPALKLLIPPGGILPTAQVQRPLPAATYTLPLLGPALARLFPAHSRLTVRVRLTSPQACAGRGNGFCPDGVLLSD